MITDNTISIRLHPDGFSLWSNDKLNQIKLEKTINFLFTMSESALIQVLNELPELTSQQKYLQIIFETPYYSFIPETLFDENSGKELLSFIFEDLPENWTTVSRKSNNKDYMMIYALPTALLNACHFLYPEAEKTHHLDFVLNHMKTEMANTIHVWFRQPYADVIRMKNDVPNFINSFHTRTSEDLIYYLFKLLEDTEQIPENISLNLYQEEKIMQSDDIRKYFPNLKIHSKNLLS